MCGVEVRAQGQATAHRKAGGHRAEVSSSICSQSTWVPKREFRSSSGMVAGVAVNCKSSLYAPGGSTPSLYLPKGSGFTNERHTCWLIFFNIA